MNGSSPPNQPWRHRTDVTVMVSPLHYTLVPLAHCPHSQRPPSARSARTAAPAADAPDDEVLSHAIASAIHAASRICQTQTPPKWAPATACQIAGCQRSAQINHSPSDRPVPSSASAAQKPRWSSRRWRGSGKKTLHQQTPQRQRRHFHAPYSTQPNATISERKWTKADRHRFP